MASDASMGEALQWILNVIKCSRCWTKNWKLVNRQTAKCINSECRDATIFRGCKSRKSRTSPMLLKFMDDIYGKSWDQVFGFTCVVDCFCELTNHPIAISRFDVSPNQNRPMFNRLSGKHPYRTIYRYAGESDEYGGPLVNFRAYCNDDSLEIEPEDDYDYDCI